MRHCRTSSFKHLAPGTSHVTVALCVPAPGAPVIPGTYGRGTVARALHYLRGRGDPHATLAPMRQVPRAGRVPACATCVTLTSEYPSVPRLERVTLPLPNERRPAHVDWDLVSQALLRGIQSKDASTPIQGSAEDTLERTEYTNLAQWQAIDG